MADGLISLRSQIGDYSSEKYDLTDHRVRLPGCSGNIVEIANWFLSPDRQIPLVQIDRMAEKPHLGRFLNFFENLQYTTLATTNLLAEAVSQRFGNQEIPLEESPARRLNQEALTQATVQENQI